MENYTRLLKGATRKLIELGDEPELKKELLPKAPPVLWFGNNATSKEKIVTIGANPSRKEFLGEDREKAKKRLANFGGHLYLKDQDSRFKVLDQNQTWSDILRDRALQGAIIESYNRYFEKKPYDWFGKKAIDGEHSYNVEGFINVLNASFFEGNKKYQCIHIDLLPFATLSDFKDIASTIDRCAFADGWAKSFLSELIAAISPKLIIVFGKANFDELRRLLPMSSEIGPFNFKAITESGYESSATYSVLKYNDFNVVGLSTNLGNPRGFSKEAVRELGEEVGGKLSL